MYISLHICYREQTSIGTTIVGAIIIISYYLLAELHMHIRSTLSNAMFVDQCGEK